ncbi:MAG: hypothetical protein R3F29_06365 [Planctomycetota bacterium]
MKTPLIPFVLLIALAAAGCGRGEVVESTPPAATGDTAARDQSAGAAKPASVADASIEPWRRELLQLAFDAASRFPSNPHHKNRGRAQDLAVAAAFGLDQPKLALSFAPRVEGWRRGAAYADYAWVAAKVGATVEANRYVELAQQVLRDEGRDPNGQDWRSDHVRLRLARALHQLGDAAGAGELTAKIDKTTTSSVDEAWAKAIASRVEGMTLEAAKKELLTIDDTWTAQPLGDQYTSLVLIGRIHHRFFDDAELRAGCEDRLFVRFDKLPLDLRTEAMRPLVDGYLEHGDQDGAREVVDKIAGFVAGFRWRPEDLIPQLAAIAGLRGKVGDADRARQELLEARQKYHEARDEIVDIYRCETLRAIGIAYADIGDRNEAIDVLTLAVEEGMENPNSRPRCDDLVETCVEMAKHAIEPSAELWARLREIRDGLNDPW